MSTRARALAAALDEAFTGPAWHGPALAAALRGVEVPEAVWRPGPDRHCIRDYALHAAYWKYVIRRRITGEKRGSFPRAGSDFFPLPDPPDRAAWQSDLELLHAEHGRLVACVRGLSGAELDRRVGRSRWTVDATVRGGALHDVYHAGQIRLLRRLFEAG